MRRGSGKTDRGFTLVELLVVIGVVAVLIALLFPALSKAKEHANRIKCAANLRSIGQALIAYTQQYNCYPGMRGSDPSGSVPDYFVWPVRVRLFMAGGKDVFYCPSEDPKCRWPELTDSAARAQGTALLLGYQKGEALLTTNLFFSYGYNGAGTGILTSGVEGQVGLGFDSRSDPLVRPSRVKCPANMIAVADSTVDGDYDSYIQPDFLFRPQCIPGKVHSGGPNVLFCDGHVAWFPQKALLIDSRTPFDRLQAPQYRMWNNDNRWPSDGNPWIP